MDFNSNITIIIQNSTKQEFIINQGSYKKNGNILDRREYRIATSLHEPLAESCLSGNVCVSYHSVDMSSLQDNNKESSIIYTPVDSRLESQLKQTVGGGGKRFKRCASLRALGTPTVGAPDMTAAEFAVNVYELVNDGWVHGDDISHKSSLNLDAEINNIIETSSTAEVSLGNIKLIF